MSAYNTTKSQINSFLKTGLWKDMEHIITERIKLYMNETISYVDTDKVLRNQGAVNELKFLITLPEAILSDLQMEEENEKMNKDKNEKELKNEQNN